MTTSGFSKRFFMFEHSFTKLPSARIQPSTQRLDENLGLTWLSVVVNRVPYCSLHCWLVIFVLPVHVTSCDLNLAVYLFFCVFIVPVVIRSDLFKGCLEKSPGWLLKNYQIFLPNYLYSLMNHKEKLTLLQKKEVNRAHGKENSQI